jgi:hypothetical protein
MKLLVKFTHGHTQNSDVSFNNCVWEWLYVLVWVYWKLVLCMLLSHLVMAVLVEWKCCKSGAFSLDKTWNKHLTAFRHQQVKEAEEAAKDGSKAKEGGNEDE